MKKYLLTVIFFFVFNISSADNMLLSERSMDENEDRQNPKDLPIRVSYGNAAGLDDLEIVGETIESVASDSNGRLEILLVPRFWEKNDVGRLFGAGIFYTEHSGTSDLVNKVELAALGLLLQWGGAVKTSKTLVMELAPYLGFGMGEYAISYAASGNKSHDSGIYAFVGVKGGAFVLLSDKVELGVELGYENFTFEDILGGSKNSITGSGPRVATILAVKL